MHSVYLVGSSKIILYIAILSSKYSNHSLFFFFFSSRRRHTRCSRDWSSDVCSSDLSGHALHGMGREDVDARMLGRGRPFILEIKEPVRRTVDLPAVEGAVNHSGTEIGRASWRGRG